nr:site-specific DNA-methyltransferase [Ruminococcus bromii]
MPTLDWIGKSKVVNHHLDVPYKTLERQYSFDRDGEHKEDNGSGNMIIHGDNLEALKSLLPQYEGRIKCIYIDPPYNTGNENWVYNDNVNDPKIKKWLGKVVGQEGEDFTRHDKWLCMMYPRLRLLEKLIAKNGVIVISIGYQEINNLMLLCNEMFSTKQIMIITVQTSGGKPNGGFNVTHEYLVVIAPLDFKPNALESSKNVYSSPYHGMNLATFNQVQRPNQAYPIFVDAKGVIKGVGESLQERVDNGKYVGDLEDFQFDYDEAPEGTTAVWPVTSKGDPCVWRLIPQRLLSDWEKGYIKVVPINNPNTINRYTIQYLSGGIIDKIINGEFEVEYSSNKDVPTIEVLNYSTAGAKIPTILTNKLYYTARGGDEVRSIFGTKSAFPYPKPEKLIEDILHYISSDNEIILDSFAGSGTTAHAVLNLNKQDGGNRKFIMIEMMDYADSITAERVKRVIDGYGEGKKAVEGTGGDFSFYELGEPIFNGDMLNEEIGEDEIRKYVYFTETKQTLAPHKADEPYYLGTYIDNAYYFYYEKKQITTLNNEFLNTIKTKAGAYVIYADLCTLSNNELEKYRITFKKIPRDISKL